MAMLTALAAALSVEMASIKIVFFPEILFITNAEFSGLCHCEFVGAFCIPG